MKLQMLQSSRKPAGREPATSDTCDIFYTFALGKCAFSKKFLKSLKITEKSLDKPPSFYHNVNFLFWK